MGTIALVISLLQTILASLNLPGNVGPEVATAIQIIQEAIQKLLGVQGTPVTYNQLESLRSQKTF